MVPKEHASPRKCAGTIKDVLKHVQKLLTMGKGTKQIEVEGGGVQKHDGRAQ